MQKHERLEGGIAIVVDDQEKVHMVGHDHVVACRERGVEPMHRPPERPHAFARARQLGALRALDEARQHGLPPFHTDREEEELQTMMGEG